MSGDDMERRGVIPMGHRNPGICRNTIARGHARHNGKRHAVFPQHLRLFSPSAKDKGITAFQTHHLFPLLRQLYQQKIGFALLFVVQSGSLSGKDQIAVRSGQV